MERRGLRLRRFGVRLSFVSVALAGLAWPVLGVGRLPEAHAQATDDRYPCVGQVDFNSLPVDATLSLSPHLAVTTRTVPASDPALRPGPVDEAHLTWDLPSAPALKCIWVGVQLPETSYFMAQYILRPGEAASMAALDIRPSGNAGSYCFRVVAMTSTARGELADRCVSIKNPQMPRGPDDGPRPPDAGSGSQLSVNGPVTTVGLAAAAIGAGMVLLSLFVRRVRR